MQMLRSAWRRLNPHWLAVRRETERVAHKVHALPDKWLRANWPQQRDNETDRHSIGIVTVNFNTRDHIARLIYSVYRTLGRDRVARLVVVDNRSTDGSVEFLTAVRDAGLIDLITNSRQRYHGPGVNQGIRHLCRVTRADRRDGVIDYVWVLDSDTVVMRADVLDHAVDELKRHRAGVAGEFAAGLPGLPEGYAHICSLLLDPLLVWRRSVEPMWESGTPAEALQLSCERRGIPRVNFGFMRDGYVIHVGSGTLAVIRDQQDERNRYREWAVSLGRQAEDIHSASGDQPAELSLPAPDMTYKLGHFHGNPDAPAEYAKFVEEYNCAVPDGTAAQLITACQASRGELDRKRSS